MIIVFIIAWILAASIFAGCTMHFWPDVYDPHNTNDAVLVMLMGLIAWWFFAVMGIGYLILKVLSKLPLFITGFLDGLRGKKDD